jgi:hypothetical protein
MDRGRVGEDRGSKEKDGCPLTEYRQPRLCEDRWYLIYIPGTTADAIC